jgi:uncharacterized protein (TIGR02145 family)
MIKNIKRGFWHFPLNLIMLIIGVFLIIIWTDKKKYSMKLGYNTVTDIDGNIYNTIKLGNQIWMKENLKTTRFNDSSNILKVTGNVHWSDLISPAYCYYDNGYLTYKRKYDVLYNWYAIKYNNLCPKEWHVPSEKDWKILSDFLGGDSLAGRKLKKAGIPLWSISSKSIIESGFSALPTGYRYVDGSFYDKGKNETWWSSTEICSKNTFAILVSYSSNYIYKINYYNKNHGFSVRCIKDSAYLKN